MNLKENRRGQPQFAKEIPNLRKVFHGAEREWLNCGDKEAKREKQKEYICGEEKNV